MTVHILFYPLVLGLCVLLYRVNVVLMPIGSEDGFRAAMHL